MIPGILLILCLFIVFKVIFPQLLSISESNSEIKNKKIEAEALSKTLSILSSLDANQIEVDLNTSTHALPTSKDIALIFSSLTSAANSSQATLREFSLKVGGIYGRAIKGVGSKGTPSIDVIAKISSPNPASFITFSREIQKRLPLSEIKSMNSSGTTATYEIGFFYKPIDIAIVAKQDRINSLSQSDINTLGQLREWDK